MTQATEPTARVPVIRGRAPKEGEKEFIEKMNTESGQADVAAAQVAGAHAEPWLNVLHSHEPASLPGFELILREPRVRERLRGKALDVGAGTCWLTAKLSRLPEVEQVFALDLSERFLSTTGLRVMKHFEADVSKVSFVVSDFNEIPLESDSLDCAFLWAAIHHSLAPIKTIQEVGRCLKKGGTLFIFESPCSVRKIRDARARMLALSESVTEIAYTRGELEYLIQNARVGELETLPVDALSRGGWRMAVRQGLRRLGVEDVLINPPCYLFMVRKR